VVGVGGGGGGGGDLSSLGERDGLSINRLMRREEALYDSIWESEGYAESLVLWRATLQVGPGGFFRL